MKFVNNIDIESLLGKPLWQLTGREFCSLTQYAHSQCVEGVETNNVVRITGVRALAEYIGCCESQIFKLRRNGVIEGAVISHVGKKIVFNGEKARELAANFQQEQRAARKNNG